MKLNFKIFILLLLFFSACKKDTKEHIALEYYPEHNEQYSGGSLTSFNTSSNAFGFGATQMNAIDNAYFAAGNSLFKEAWVTAPSSTTARDGLGPYFNSNSCSACHFKDGRGRAPEYPGEKGTGLLLRIGRNANDPYASTINDQMYGDQLQDQAIMGLDEEFTYSISHTTLSGSYADGSSYTLLQPNYDIAVWNYGNPEPNHQISPRVGQQLIGLGLVEAISEADILANVDEFDSDNNGISGKANYAWSVEHNQLQLGRFGWKANQPTLKQQIAGAFNGDMGITSTIFPDQNYTNSQSPQASGFANGGIPEISDLNLHKVYLYMSNIKVPARRNYDSQDILQGKTIFKSIGCAECHQPTFTTSNHNDFSYLQNQKIWPYSDFLLHDMGDSLSDAKTDYSATENEWRTPALWGIGLLQTVNGHQKLLHDGRANGIEEAILWHGGESARSKNKFTRLSFEERQKLIDFINSL